MYIYIYLYIYIQKCKIPSSNFLDLKLSETVWTPLSGSHRDSASPSPSGMVWCFTSHISHGVSSLPALHKCRAGLDSPDRSIPRTHEPQSPCEGQAVLQHPRLPRLKMVIHQSYQDHMQPTWTAPSAVNHQLSECSEPPELDRSRCRHQRRILP